MKEIKVGSHIVLEAVEDKEGTCKGCFFDELVRDIYKNCCNGLKCCSTERKDCKSVIFKLVED